VTVVGHWHIKEVSLYVQPR